MTEQTQSSTTQKNASAIAHSLGDMMHRFDHRWGWMLALGLVSIVFGCLALVLVVASTLTSVLLIGLMMMVAGGFEISVGASSRTWSHFFLWILAGVLYVLAGAVAIAQPALAATVFTLLLGAGFFVTGALRMWLGTKLPMGARNLTFLSGAVSLFLGLLIMLSWPRDSLWVLGTLLGVDLIFSGVRWVSLSMTLRRFAHAR